MTCPAVFWYRYSIDRGVITPAAINRLWQMAWIGTDLEDVFGVVDDGGSAGELDEPVDWWWRPGSGCSLVRAGDDERDRILLRFFLENLHCFDTLTYGPLMQSDVGFNVRLLASAALAMGDAA